MPSKKLTLVTSLFLSALALTACDKQDTKETTKDTKTTTASAPAPVVTSTTTTTVSSTPATTSVATSTTTTMSNTTVATTGVSPTVQLWVDSSKIGVLMMLKQQNPKLTSEQIDCLKSPEADATYLPKAKSEMTRILTPEEMNTTDAFYNSELGKKVVAMTHQQIKQAIGEPVGTPITLSENEQKAVVAFMQNPSAKKIQADTAKMSDKEAEAMIRTLADKEKARCKLA